MSTWALIVAAGRGERAGLGRNKIYYQFDGRSVLGRCLDAMTDSDLFDGIAVVISATDAALFRETMDREGPFELVKVVAEGGATRRDSVRNGLESLPEGVDIVAIHDAARPFVTRQVIKATIDAARRCGSGVIATPVVDTIKQLRPDGTVTSLDRNTLRAVQTPQTFSYDRILRAHRLAQRENLPVTDDAMLFEHYYGSVELVTAEGAEENRKLTTKADFDALRHPRLPEFRVGQGYDVHRLVEGRKLILCGVEVPHTMGLDGHSDADVAVHALMDALLGAIGEGDIGRHFPDNDPAYEGADSMRLLDAVMGMGWEKGYSVCNADVTIVAQRPKLMGYIPEMRRRVAEGLQIDIGRVNVKATTTERLGFEGEEKGISAQAVVLLASQTNQSEDSSI